MKTLHQRIYDEMEERRLLGLKKYWKTLDDNPLTETQRIQHAKEEAMDLVLYLQKLIDEKQR